MALQPSVHENIVSNSVRVTLRELTWTESSTGKYYSYIYTFTNGETLLSLYIGEWGGLRSDDLIQPFYENNKIGLIWNKNTPAAFGSYIQVCYAYK